MKRIKTSRVRPQAAGRKRSRKADPGRSPIKAIPAEAQELESLRAQLERVSRSASPPRWNANPEDVKRSVVKLVLTLVELIRQLLERQAIRRMENHTLSPEETEAIGLALMRLEETIRELGGQFDLTPEDLNLDLGPVGRLL
jgi:gas vesicle protein GvpK